MVDALKPKAKLVNVILQALTLRAAQLVPQSLQVLGQERFIGLAHIFFGHVCSDNRLTDAFKKHEPPHAAAHLLVFAEGFQDTVGLDRIRQRPRQVESRQKPLNTSDRRFVQ